MIVNESERYLPPVIEEQKLSIDVICTSGDIEDYVYDEYDW